MTETKRSRRRLSPGSRSTGGRCTGTKEELVEGDESGTSGISLLDGGDEFDRPTPLDKKVTGLVSS